MSKINLASCLSSHCSLYFCHDLSMSNYSKSSALLIFKPFVKEASWKCLMQTHLEACFLLVFVFFFSFVFRLPSWGQWEPVVHRQLDLCWAVTKSTGLWASPYPVQPLVGWESKYQARGYRSPEPPQFGVCYSSSNSAWTLTLASLKESVGGGVQLCMVTFSTMEAFWR